MWGLGLTSRCFAWRRASSALSTCTERAWKRSQKLVDEMTVRNGRIVWDLNGLAREDWRKLPDNYMAQGDPSWDGMVSEGRRGRRRR